MRVSGINLLEDDLVPVPSYGKTIPFTKTELVDDK
jgi:hypothetical protein